jgi:hypothetical protein
VVYSRLAEALRRQSFRGPRDLLDLTADDIERSLGVNADVASTYVRRLGRAGQLQFDQAVGCGSTQAILYVERAPEVLR